MTDAIGPTSSPRPALPSRYNLTSAAVSSQIGVIVTWAIGLGIKELPVAVPSEVQGAVNMLVAGGIAAAIAYAASRMRFSQWREAGEVTGLKKLL